MESLESYLRSWKRIENSYKKPIEKVDWRKEYMLDNIANIVMGIMTIVLIFISPMTALLPICVSLYVNLSANGFFNKEKYK